MANNSIRDNVVMHGWSLLNKYIWNKKNKKKMITICVMPAFVGTIKEKIQALIVCLALDSIYILPMVLWEIITPIKPKLQLLLLYIGNFKYKYYGLIFCSYIRLQW